MTGQALLSATNSGSAASGLTSPFSLSISPATVVVATGQRSYSERITLSNNGGKPVMISASAVGAHEDAGRCVAGPPQPWAHIAPVSFRLRPGHHHVFTFTVSAPQQLTGKHSVVALFTGHVIGAKAGSVDVAGALGSQVVLRLTGPTSSASECAVVVPVKHKALAATGASHSSALAGGALLGGLLGVLALSAGIATFLGRRRAKRAGR